MSPQHRAVLAELVTEPGLVAREIAEELDVKLMSVYWAISNLRNGGYVMRRARPTRLRGYYATREGYAAFGLDMPLKVPGAYGTCSTEDCARKCPFDAMHCRTCEEVREIAGGALTSN